MKKILKYVLRTILILFVLLNVITAFHAYKFTHFYNAGEINVKSKREKNKWDFTKEILFGINAVKRPNKKAADSISQTVYLLTEDKIKIEAWHQKGVGTGKGTVIMFHGHNGTKSGVMNEAEAFRKMGYHIMMIDFRAHGGSGGNTCTIGFYEAEEVKLAYDYVKEKGEKNIVLWGISMGAAAISKAVVDYDLQPDRIILEMPFGTLLEAAAGRIKKMGLTPQPFAALVTFWGGVEHGFWAFNMNPAEFAKQINIPTLVQWGKKDPRVSKSETDLIYQNLPAEKKLVVYENCAHESLCRKENSKWLNEVQIFLAN